MASICLQVVHGVVSAGAWNPLHAHLVLTGCGILEGLLLPAGLLIMNTGYRQALRQSACVRCSQVQEEITGLSIKNISSVDSE